MNAAGMNEVAKRHIVSLVFMISGVVAWIPMYFIITATRTQEEMLSMSVYWNVLETSMIFLILGSVLLAIGMTTWNTAFWKLLKPRHQ
jgi:tetrahydromethanopterin S-methyltransferase subunit C